MTDQDDTPPGAGDTGPGRRRARVDHIADELAALRRDLSGHAGLLAELAPRVDQLHDTVTGLVGAVAALSAAAEQQAEQDDADLEARRAAGLANEPPAPWCWPVMTREDAQAAWTALDRWVASVLVGQHQLPLHRLPGCWPAHPAAVGELTALRASHVAAHVQRAHPAAALSWARELPAALDRLATAIPADRCPPGLHLLDPNREPPPQRERDRVGAMPCRPDAWRGLLAGVVESDLVGRRAKPTAQR